MSIQKFHRYSVTCLLRGINYRSPNPGVVSFVLVSTSPSGCPFVRGGIWFPEERVRGIPTTGGSGDPRVGDDSNG